MCVCLCICLFSIEIQTAGWIGMKFGTEVVLEGENFKKQKLQGTPNLVGVGHLFGPQIQIWKDLGPMSFWIQDHSL